MGGMPPPPPGGDPSMGGTPVMLMPQDLDALLQKALDAKGGSSQADGNGDGRVTVKELAGRIDNLEGMLTQLLQASGIMPPEQPAAPPAPGAGDLPPPPEMPEGMPKTAAESEALWRAKQSVKRAPLLAVLRKINEGM